MLPNKFLSNNKLTSSYYIIIIYCIQLTVSSLLRISHSGCGAFYFLFIFVLGIGTHTWFSFSLKWQKVKNIKYPSLFSRVKLLVASKNRVVNLLTRVWSSRNSYLCVHRVSWWTYIFRGKRRSQSTVLDTYLVGGFGDMNVFSPELDI